MVNTVSVRKITWKYLSIILAISLLGLFLIVRMGWVAVEEDVHRHHSFEANVLQRQFSEVFGFYQGIAAQLSQRTEVADILAFGGKAEAASWAREVRSLIPESIGVALINSEGIILGEPLQLNLGPQCVDDLQQLFSGNKIGSPPVHRFIPELAHFDITQEVVRNGEVIGVLFISFSLNVIQRRAEQLITEGQVLLIEDSDGTPVVQLGANNTLEHLGSEHPRVMIENTDWSLHYDTDEYEANALFSPTLLIVVAILVAIIVAMVVLSLKLVGLFKSDLILIKDQLSGVYLGGRGRLPAGQTVLSETGDIMDDVWVMMEKIEQANDRLKEISVNDELSGVLNRRGFNEQLEHSWELSTRGCSSSLVYLDLDYFKQVNDRFGHTVGDQVIVALAQALKERCRKTDIIGRLGGDEFAMIFNSSPLQEGVEQCFQQIEEYFYQLQLEIFAGNESAICSISAGAVPLDKGLYDEIKIQIEAADRALYQAKQQGRGRIICDYPSPR